jgi:hypothetical protein
MKGLNEACTGGCGLGLQCVGTVCLPLGTEHQVCSPNFDGPQCQRGLTCLANVCVVDLPGDVGATCQETKVCQSNLFCSIPSGMTSGTCVERRAVNGPCVYGDQCQSDLFCTGHSNQTGVCIAGLASDPCQYGYAQCRHDLYCTATANTPSGQCAHKKGEGESCQRPDECLNSCVNAVCTRPYCTL